MTKEEKIAILKDIIDGEIINPQVRSNVGIWAIKALEQSSYNSIKTELKPCDDAISRQAVLDEAFEVDTKEYGRIDVVGVDVIDALLPVNPQPKIGYCRDCKWWKDTDGVFRRGIEAESQCPMNRIEVYEGNGYCYMFEPQESEE